MRSLGVACLVTTAAPVPGPPGCRQRLAEEKALLEAIKELKLAELAAAHVPLKYHSQLARMQV